MYRRKINNACRKGHKYWHNFSQEAQDEIEKLADSINKLLFEPLVKRPIKSLDLPICDKNNNTLTLVYDFVSFVNADEKNKDKDDPDGQATIRCLKSTEKMVQLFSSTAPDLMASIQLYIVIPIKVISVQLRFMERWNL